MQGHCPQQSNIGEVIAGAAAASGIFLENAPFHQIEDISIRGILRALGEPRPFGRGQLALEIAQDLVDYLDLPVIESLGGKPFPKARLEQHRRQQILGSRDRTCEAA